MSDVHAWQAQSLLLDYPDERLLARLELLQRVAETLPEPVGAPLLRFLDHVGRTPAPALSADYVSTFDNQKRCCPYLTYYAHGDTRERGMALLRLKKLYRAGGLPLASSELPDHLTVMLAFAALAPPGHGEALLTEHRPAIELLRLSLHDLESPYAHVLDAIAAVLPALSVTDRGEVARLAREGPPEEAVGLQPYGPPEAMPEGAHV